MDFRKEVNEMLRDDGINVLYRRRSKMIQCTCVVALHNSADPKCPTCEGTGKMVSFEKMRIVTNPNSAGAGSSSVQQTDLGQAYSPSQIVVAEHSSHLQPGDMIYIVGWKGNYPISLHRVLELTFAEPMRQENGRGEYSLGYAKVNPDEVKRAKAILTRITGREIEVRD